MTSPASLENSWNSPLHQPAKQAATRLLSQNDYQGAADAYQRGVELALSHNDLVAAGRFAFNRSSTLMALGRFREALTTYQQARTWAEAAHDSATSQTIPFALANLYMAFGDRTAAAVAARQGLSVLRQTADLPVRMRLLLILGRLETRERGLEAGLPYFSDAIALGQELDAAPTAGTQSHEAEAWDNFGFEASQLHLLAAAQDAHCRGWHLRHRRHDPRLPQSYPLLARTFLDGGDLPRARFWNERATQHAASLRLRKPWTLRHREGLIAEGLGNLPAAYAAYQAALDEARRWRTGLIPSDHFRTLAEVEISDLFDDFLRVAHALPRTVDRERDTFQALQESHAWSLQAQLETAAEISRRLPPAYHHELAAVRKLESQLLSQNNPSVRAEADQRRVLLLEMETAAGMPTQISGRAPIRPETLSATEAVLTFHTAEPTSQLWLLTRHGLQVAELPGRRALAAAAQQFQKSVRENSPTLRADGHRLLLSLLGRLQTTALALPEWRIVLDDGLFDIPFAALSVNEREFLVESHTVLQVPTLGVSVTSKPLHGSLLGVADPIFNRADPRYLKPTSPFWSKTGWLRQETPAAGPELPRLPGSLAEARQALSTWGEGHLLTGADLAPDSLGRTLQAEAPAILHLATHAIPMTASGSSESVALALGLATDGQLQFFGQRDIMALSQAPALVVMSACQSGQGEQRPGAGVIGLTRAWLMAGSDSVIATYWPVLDDAGPFFSTFYRHVASETSMTSDGRGRFAVAAALRQSQQTCLRSSTFRAQPRYWAGFFAAGKG